MSVLYPLISGSRPLPQPSCDCQTSPDSASWRLGSISNTELCKTINTSCDLGTMLGYPSTGSFDPHFKVNCVHLTAYKLCDLGQVT